MAIYHAHTSYVSRGTGSSVCGHVAYISGDKIKEDRTGNVYDYSKKKREVLHTSILLPDGFKGQKTAEKLWNKVDLFEDEIANARFGKLKDPEQNAKSLTAKERFLAKASTAFKMECALPEELSSFEKIELAERLAREIFLSKNLVVQYAIHDKKENPHVHFVSNFRPVVDGHFSKRKLYFKSADIKALRKQVADITNAFAIEKGYDFAIDHRSLKNQGVEREPTRHEGWYATHQLQDSARIREENLEIFDANAKLFLEDPEELLKRVVADKTVFSLDDLTKGLGSLVGSQTNLEILMRRLEGEGAPELLEKAKTFGAFCDVALECRDLFLMMKEQNAKKGSDLHQDYQDKKAERGELASEIAKDIEGYAWFMAKVGLRAETLYVLAENHKNIKAQKHISTSNGSANFETRVEGEERIEIRDKSEIPQASEERRVISGGYKTYFHDGALPFDLHELPQDLRSGDMLASLAAAFGDKLSQKLIDLFNLKDVGQSLRRTTLYMGEGDLAVENRLASLKTSLMQQDHKRGLFSKDPLKAADKILSSHAKTQGYALTDPQQQAVRHLMTPPLLSILQGKAGTGKTTVLRSVAEAYAKAGYRVLGTSFQGAAVGELSSSIGTSLSGAYTLDKLAKAWRKADMLQKTHDNTDINAKTVLIVDEASMAPSRLMLLLLERALAKGAKVILVGDPGQLGSIERGQYGRLLIEGGFVLEDVQRQKNTSHRAASLALSHGHVEQALSAYRDTTHIQDTSFAAKLNLALSYVAEVTPQALKDHMVLAFRNQDVKDFNLLIQRSLHDQGKTEEGITVLKGYSALTAQDRRLIWEQFTNVSVLKDEIPLSYNQALDILEEHPTDPLLQKLLKPQTLYVGDKIMFTRNQYQGQTKGETFYNGDTGVIQSCDKATVTLKVRRDKGDEVEVDLASYAHLDLGYAMSIHRSQGKTTSHTHVYLENTNRAQISQNLLYVAMTRHRESLTLYTSRDYLADKDLSEKVRHHVPLTHHDMQNKERRGVMRDLYDASTQAKTLWGEIQRDVHAGNHDVKDHPRIQEFYAAKETRKEMSLRVLSAYSDYAPYMTELPFTKETLSRWSGLKPYQPKPQDEQMARYLDLCQKASTLWKEIKQDPFHHPSYAAFNDLKAQRNALAYQLTTLGLPKEGDMLLKAGEGKRLLQHCDQYIKDKTKPTEKPDLSGFFERVYQSIDIESYAKEALGSKPTLSGDYLRFGEKGHLAVHRALGTWVNFKEGTSGSLLGSNQKPGLLSQTERSATLRDHLELAKNHVAASVGDDIISFLKGKKVKHQQEPTHLCQERHQLRKASLEIDTSKKIALVYQRLKDTRLIQGTPAETYLKSRSIRTSCEDVRFKEVMVRDGGPWKTMPSMVAVIRGSDGKIQGLQTTLLTPDGHKNTQADVVKRTSGILKGGSVLIQKDGTNRVILAEGVETALSLKQAGVKGEIRAVLGINNFKTQWGLAGKEVVIAADNDTHKNNPQLQKTIQDAVTSLNAKIIMPDQPGHDFNDVLIDKGEGPILKAFGQTSSLDLEATITQNRALLQEGKPVQMNDQLLSSERKYLSAVLKDKALSETISQSFKDGLRQDLKMMNETHKQQKIERSEGFFFKI